MSDPTDAARQLWDQLALSTEHEDIDAVEAFRRMCEAAVKAYDRTEDQHIADWAREALRILDERQRRDEQRSVTGEDEFLIDDE